jgi:hypothetical protein
MAKLEKYTIKIARTEIVSNWSAVLFALIGRTASIEFTQHMSGVVVPRQNVAKVFPVLADHKFAGAFWLGMNIK